MNNDAKSNITQKHSQKKGLANIILWLFAQKTRNQLPEKVKKAPTIYGLFQDITIVKGKRASLHTNIIKQSSYIHYKGLEISTIKSEGNNISSS